MEAVGRLYNNLCKPLCLFPRQRRFKIHVADTVSTDTYESVVNPVIEAVSERWEGESVMMSLHVLGVCPLGTTPMTVALYIWERAKETIETVFANNEGGHYLLVGTTSWCTKGILAEAESGGCDFKKPMCASNCMLRRSTVLYCTGGICLVHCTGRKVPRADPRGSEGHLGRRQSRSAH